MIAGEFGGLDLAFEPVRGARAFEVDSLGRLTGVYKVQAIWKPGENESECLTDRMDVTMTMRAISGLSAYRTTYGTTAAAPVIPSQGGHTVTWSPSPAVPTSLGPVAPRPFPLTGGPGWTSPDIQIEAALPPTPPPHLATCNCGFHGYYDGSDDYGTPARVSGVIEGYGQVVIGTRGFRATKARIVALCVEDPETWTPRPGAVQVIPKEYGAINRHFIMRVRRNYPDVPFFDTFTKMVEEFPTDVGREITPDNDPDFWTRQIR